MCFCKIKTEFFKLLEIAAVKTKTENFITSTEKI